jgi:hypothetical protein
MIVFLKPQVALKNCGLLVLDQTKELFWLKLRLNRFKPQVDVFFSPSSMISSIAALKVCFIPYSEICHFSQKL